MLLNKLELRNFKGMTVYVDFSDEVTTIEGTNASGKTTIMNAYLWLLTGKDGEGRSDYEIKPAGAKGVDVEVTGTFTIEGKPEVFTRLYKERWVKANGQLKKEFTGHTTEFIVDGSATTKTAYTKLIKETFGVEIDLLSTPMGFTRVPWRTLREILVKMAGVDTTSIDGVEHLLKDRTPEDALKALKTTRNKAAEKKEALQAKVEERARDLSTEEIDIDAIDSSIKEAEEGIFKKQAELVAGSTVEGVDELNRAYAEAEKKKIDAVAVHKTSLRKKREELGEKRYGIEREIREDKDKDLDIQRIRGRVDMATKQKEELLDEYHRLKEMKQEDEGICGTCGQDLPQHMKETAAEKFNAKKARLTKKNVEAGKDLKVKLQSHEDAIKKLQEAQIDIPKLQAEVGSLLAEIAQIDVDIAKPERLMPEDIQQLEAARFLARRAIDEAMQTGGLEEETKKALDKDIAELKIALGKLQDTRTTHAARETSKRRIKELKKEAKQIEAQYSSLSKDIFDIETAVKELLDKTTSAINALFKSISFRLFEVQINGGYKEVCEPTIKGVPFGTANNGARVHAGVEIASRLQEYFDTRLPIWIDNAESVVESPTTGAQTILLKVSEEFEQLNVT